MESVAVVDHKVKLYTGLISLLPAIAFLLSLVYYIFLLLPLTRGHHVLYSGEGITSQHYGTLFAMLAISSIISAVVLIYFIWFLVRIKTINRPTKMIWILILLAVPVSFILFWYFVIRREPKYVPVNTDIR